MSPLRKFSGHPQTVRDRTLSWRIFREKVGPVSNPLGGPEFGYRGLIFLADGSPGSDLAAQKAGSTLGLGSGALGTRFRGSPGRLLVAPGGSWRLQAAFGCFWLRSGSREKGGEAAGAEHEQLKKER